MSRFFDSCRKKNFITKIIPEMEWKHRPFSPHHIEGNNFMGVLQKPSETGNILLYLIIV
jgi:hypothetical protein